MHCGLSPTRLRTLPHLPRALPTPLPHARCPGGVFDSRTSVYSTDTLSSTGPGRRLAKKAAASSAAHTGRGALGPARCPLPQKADPSAPPPTTATAKLERREPASAVAFLSAANPCFKPAHSFTVTTRLIIIGPLPQGAGCVVACRHGVRVRVLAVQEDRRVGADPDQGEVA